MPAFASAATFADLCVRFDYAFKPWPGGYFFRPVLNAETVAAGEVREIIGLPVQIIAQDHGLISSLGLRIGNFAYCTDVVRLDNTALKALENLNIFIVDCFTRGDAHPTHAHLDQVLDWVDRLRPKQTILTHMGPNMDYRWLMENLPAGMVPGYDGMVLTA
jgi:phosphoribosyl 1,2-cyclic phosphate phosphodiesterase